MFTEVESAIVYVKESLLSTRRPGMKKLINHMEEQGFFEAPCSGGNHLCCKHGLVVHTANVIENSLKLGKTLLSKEEFKGMKNSIIICAGLHDLGKMGQGGRPFYVENIVKDGRPTKANPEQRFKQSETKPFMQNKENEHIEHCFRSIMEAYRYIDLSEEEIHAILCHDGLYGSVKYDIMGHETKLQTIIHWGDFWVAQFEEPKFLTGNPESIDEEFEME